MTYENLKPHFERDFNCMETMSVLKHNINIYWSWGVKSVKIVEPTPNEKGYAKGLLLNVSANRHKGYVFITLGYDDTYNARLMNNRGRVIDSFIGVYFDELVKTIDDRIERIADYNF